jgi:NitT/TauT family transport system substrate-binding protein
MRHLQSALAVLGLLAVAAAAPSARAEILAISEYGKITSTLPWAVALKQGFLRQDGLDITEIVSSSGGGGALRNLLASGLGVGQVGTTTALAAINQGIDLRMVMCTTDNLGDLTWATMKSSRIRSVKDLAGTRVAFTSPHSTTEIVLRAAVAQAGLTGKVDLIAIGGLGPGLTALSQGTVAAAPLVDPALSLEPDKYRVLFRGSDVFPKFTAAVIVATPEFIRQHPDKLRALLRARRRAVEFMEQHREETERIYSQVFGFSLEDARKLLPKYYAWGQFSHGAFSREGLEATSRGMQLVGLIDKPVDWSRIVDQRFLAPDQQGKLW